MEKLIKNLNHLFNPEFDADKEAENIMRYLMHKSSTQEAMQVFNRLEFRFMEEMKNREIEAQKICRTVNSKYPKSTEINLINLINVNDPIFELPIKNNHGKIKRNI